MPTSVRIRDEDKDALDALQARLMLAGAGRVPLEEVLHRAIRVAQDHEAELLDDTPPELTQEARDYFLSLPSDFGVETDESTIDRDLYGLEREPA